MLCRAAIFVATVLLCGTACSRPPAKPVENLGGGQDVGSFVLAELKGTRNGDRLDVRAVYSGNSQQIVVELRFKVTSPARLEAGNWKGLGAEGGVHERSSTFLGGQSGPPSIGGRFDLLGTDGQPRYRVAIPLQPLNERL